MSSFFGIHVWWGGYRNRENDSDREKNSSGERTINRRITEKTAESQGGFIALGASKKYYRES